MEGETEVNLKTDVAIAFKQTWGHRDPSFLEPIEMLWLHNRVPDRTEIEILAARDYLAGRIRDVTKHDLSQVRSKKP